MARSPSSASTHGGSLLLKKRRSLLAPGAASKRRSFLHTRSKSAVTSSKLGSLRRVFSSPPDTPKSGRKGLVDKDKGSSRSNTPSYTPKHSPTFTSTKSVNDTVASKPELKKGSSESDARAAGAAVKKDQSSKVAHAESDLSLSPILISTPEEAAAAMDRSVASASAAPGGPRRWRAPGAQSATSTSSDKHVGARVSRDAVVDQATAAVDVSGSKPPPVVIPPTSNQRPRLRGLFRPLANDADSVRLSTAVFVLCEVLDLIARSKNIGIIFLLYIFRETLVDCNLTFVCAHVL